MGYKGEKKGEGRKREKGERRRKTRDMQRWRCSREKKREGIMREKGEKETGEKRRVKGYVEGTRRVKGE